MNEWVSEWVSWGISGGGREENDKVWQLSMTCGNWQPIGIQSICKWLVHSIFCWQWILLHFRTWYYIEIVCHLIGRRLPSNDRKLQLVQTLSSIPPFSSISRFSILVSFHMETNELPFSSQVLSAIKIVISNNIEWKWFIMRVAKTGGQASQHRSV